MIKRFERFIFTISEIDRHWHKISGDAMQKYDLKGPYAIYLVIMRRYEDGITSAKMAEICGRNKADVSRAVTDMEKKGLVKRESVNNNNYRAKLILTEQGNEAAEQVCVLAARAVEMSGLPAEKCEQFYENLESIASNLKTVCEKGLEQK